MSELGGFDYSKTRRNFLHDQYAALAHKSFLGDGFTNLRPFGTPSWVADADARRLAAYEILAAYRDNVTRYYLPLMKDDVDESWRKLREYGHAQLLIKQARALLLGRSQEIVVPDAQGTDEDDDAPDEPGTKPSDGPASDLDPDRARAQTFLEWLEQWVEDEKLETKLLEMEESAVGQGDGVLVLGWDTIRNRPRLRVFDPGFYFPDLSEDADDGSDDEDDWGDTAMSTDDEFPRTVHVAYEYLGRDSRPKLRRFTYELLSPDLALDGVQSQAYRVPWEDGPKVTSDGEEVPTLTCLYSDRTYDIARLTGGQKVYNITSQPETERANRRDLRIDFIPVVHIPNDAAGSRHFGQSLITCVSQVLDDMMSTDTDLNDNSSLVGSTPTVITGGGAANLQAGPGATMNLPTGATVAMLDTSKNLDALLKQSSHLSDVMATNARVASALLGNVNPEQVPSGYAMALGFAPTVALINEMRAVRKIKYSLLLKFALRMAQAYGVLPAGQTPAAFVQLGPFLPSDQQYAIDAVKALIPLHAISIETAVLMLRDAGLPIEDIAEEIQRIQHQNFEKAIALADATGDNDAVREYLGLPEQDPDEVDPPTPPVIDPATGLPVAPVVPPGIVDPAPQPPVVRPVPPRSLDKQ